MGSIDHSFSASRLPVASWDTHVHVFDSTIGPFAEGNAYTPGHAPLTELRRFTQSLGEGDAPVNLVIVQASPYGTDNSVLLSSLKTLQADSKVTARGIAVVDIHNVTDAELWALHEAGVRGLRLNKMASHHTFSVGALISDIKLAASRIKQLPNWKLQLFVSGRFWDDIYETVLSLPVTVIADHIGGMLAPSKLPSVAQNPTNQPGFRSLVELAKRSKVIIKISGLYRLSTAIETGYHDLEPIIRALADVVPDRLIYASDWPHTGDGSNRGGRKPGEIEKFRVVDNNRIVENLSQWIGSEARWNRIMVSTPASIFN